MSKDDRNTIHGTKEYWIKHVREVACKLGYTPTRYDLSSYEMKNIKRHYTAWIKVIDDAGLERPDKPEQKELRARIVGMRWHDAAVMYHESKKIKADDYKFLKGEMLRERARIPDGYDELSYGSTDEEMVAYVKALGEELTFTPTPDFVKGSGCIVARFVSWDNFITECGLEGVFTDHQAEMRKKATDRWLAKELTAVYENMNAEDMTSEGESKR